MINIYGKEIFTTLSELVNPEYTALLLIDIQNDFCCQGGSFDKMGLDMSMLQQVPRRVKPVLRAARRSGVLVMHIRNTCHPNHVSDSGAWLHMLLKNVGIDLKASMKEDQQVLMTTMEGTWGWQEVDEVAPQPGESIIKKHRSSAFIGTDLDMILRSNGIKSVVSVGVATEGCVESTARDAQFFDYYPVLLRDCVATRKSEIHEAAMLVMSTRFDVQDSSEIIDIWDKRVRRRT